MDDQTDSPDDYHAICLRAAAHARGWATRYVQGVYSRFHPHPSRWLRVEVGGRGYLFASGMLLIEGADPWRSLGLHINEDAILLTCDKRRAKDFLEAQGFSTPAGRLFRRTDLPAALDAFPSFATPVCVKPNQGSKGELVFPSIGDRARYERAIRRVAAQHRKILVEESVSGQLIRFFYVRPRVVAVKLSRPASVVGDGIASIAQLIEAKNELRQRRAVPGHSDIQVDDDLRDFLAMTGRDLADVPAPSERVFLRGTSNGATGADSIDCRRDLHPSYSDVIAAACNAVPGLNLTAADVMIRDPSLPAQRGNYWILELNRNPGITPYHFPWRGEEQDVAGAILDFLAQGAATASTPPATSCEE
ncbi:hypothetical protein [Azospirillum lipoferum]|uniref:ATP-grasp domain-containing protein n=1 Tax=Azospirillum lipoferum (strain 4B) TaxID=862719 RepID=G7ZBX5_AZOL4|nr:hypothetical protein [Azospirillum lipoferum]CBS88969.1 protein of unknown function [Azospirillum lipoferum 4B]